MDKELVRKERKHIARQFWLQLMCDITSYFNRPILDVECVDRFGPVGYQTQERV